MKLWLGVPLDGYDFNFCNAMFVKERSNMFGESTIYQKQCISNDINAQ